MLSAILNACSGANTEVVVESQVCAREKKSFGKSQSIAGTLKAGTGRVAGVGLSVSLSYLFTGPAISISATALL
jgi:hypothetical protein